MATSRVLLEDISSVVSNEKLLREFTNTAVLVTGATGLIGSELVRVFVAANDTYSLNIKVLAHARSEEKAQEVLGELIDRDDVQMIYAHGFDFEVNCQYIIHAACPTTSKFFVEHPVDTIDVSLEGTRKMLALATKNRVNGMVYLSSMEEYGIPCGTDTVMTEDKCGYIDHLSVRSCYPESKRMCECYCASFAAQYGTNVFIVRLAQTFGAGVPISDNRVFMQFARSVIHKKNIILHTLGKSMSNFCYVSDAVEGILTVLLKGSSGEAYNVCNDGETRSIANIAELVAEKIAGGTIQVVYDIPESSLKYGYAPDVTMQLCSDKLKALGWTPMISMQEAYERLIEYIKEAEAV